MRPLNVPGAIENYKEMLKHLEGIKKCLHKENPIPIFLFTIESKIRAYTRKLQRATKEDERK